MHDDQTLELTSHSSTNQSCVLTVLLSVFSTINALLLTSFKSLQAILGENKNNKATYNTKESNMPELRVVTVKLAEEIYQELALRIPEGDRSTFIRDAIAEKLQTTPKPDKLLALQQRLTQLEEQFGQIQKYLNDLDILTFQHGKINPYQYAQDEVDRQTIEYLLNYKSATTPEIADYLKTNRWLVLNRLQRIEKTSQKQAGKSIIEYYAGERSGKKKAWWLNETLIQE